MNQFLIAFGIGGLSLLVASALAVQTPMRLAIGIVVGVALWTLAQATVRRAGRRRHMLAENLNELLVRVARLSLEEARRRAFVLLADAERFTVVQATETRALSPRVGPITTDFFALYNNVQAVRGAMQLRVDLVSSSNLNPKYVRIGSNDEVEIVVRAEDDAIGELEGRDEEVEWLPSIYHYIVFVTAWEIDLTDGALTSAV